MFKVTPMPTPTRPAFRTWSGLLSILILLLLAGCGAVKKDKLAVGLQSATNAYQSALRWGYYETAYDFLHPDVRQGKPLPKVLDGLRLTGYDVVQPPTIQGEETATQIVMIEYLHEDRQIVKQITDRQLWRWDESVQAWRLHSGLPKFE